MEEGVIKMKGLSEQDKIANKWHAHYNHFKDRLVERYGLSISYREYRELCRGEIIFHSFKSKSVRSGFVLFGSKWVFVIYSVANLRQIYTAMKMNPMAKKQLKKILKIRDEDRVKSRKLDYEMRHRKKLNSEPEVQECDATKPDQGTEAGNQNT